MSGRGHGPERRERWGKGRALAACSVEMGRGAVCGRLVPQDCVLRSEMVEVVETR